MFIVSKKMRNNCINIVVTMLLTVLLSALLPGCSSAPKISTSTIFAMDTVMQLEIQGDDALLLEAESKIRNIENSLSVTKKDSQIWKLNKDKEAEFSEENTHILEEALKVCDMTDGCLDVSVYPVLKEWGFTTGEYKVPSDDRIKELSKNVDHNQISIEAKAGGGSVVKLKEGMEIDLGSVVKGYTGSSLAKYFKDKGVTSGLINLGGNVECIGSKTDGKPWKVAVKSPFPDSKSGVLGVLEAVDTSIITSGGYERFFEENGEIYWHILDPKTGYPAKNGLVSVTIVGNNGLVGDGLSTALFVKGKEGAIEFISQHGDDLTKEFGFGAVLVTEDGKVYITENIASDFVLSSEYQGLEIIIL